jgi:NAD(P)-dependent dehydrogenase (short-subunit alcohol dehydrogenase family)
LSNERKGAIDQPAVYPSLKDRVVFITGGGSGIGESLVEHFCAQGAKVAFVDIAEAPSTALVERIAAKGERKPLFMPCDLRDIDALKACVAKAAKELGPIRVLLNNAGNDDRHATADGTVD